MSVKKKFLIGILLMNILVCCVSMNLLHANASLWSDMNKQAKDFTTTGSTEATKGGLDSVTSTMTESFSGLGQILTFIGTGVMVGVVAFMGIKYLVSPPDKQAALKQQLIGVLVAGIVIFGAYGIWSAIIDIGSKID